MSNITKTYNERLFEKGSIRSFFHQARFRWLENSIKRYCPNAKTFIELGCFDGRSVHYLPKNFLKYNGYDANWEDGLDIALENFKNRNNIVFHNSETIANFNLDDEKYDVAFSLETMEHLYTSELGDYIYKLSKATNDYLFITVPNEKGLVLLIKFILKKLIIRDGTMRHTWKEIWYGMIGHTHKIVREERGHKGFDYNNLIINLSKHFDLIKKQGLPFSFLPSSMNFTIGIILKTKKNNSSI